MNFDSYETSSAQKRLYMLRKLFGESCAYNIPRVMIIRGDLDYQRFEKAFDQLIKRHESLRTAFEFTEGEVVQNVYSEVSLIVEYTLGTEAELDQLIDEFIRPFDLSQPPLLRVKLVKVKANLHFCLLDMDHLIIDGFSLGIFTRELIALYGGIELPEPELQYVDFVMWQNDLLASGEIKKQEEYWLEKFCDGGSVLDLPTDFPRSEKRDLQGSNLWHYFDEELSAEIRRFTAQTMTTTFMFLLAVLNLLLSRYADQEDIVIGSPIAGRQHKELLQIIGLFVNTLALRNQPDGEKRFIDFLSEVKENCLQAYRNQDYQFEMLVDQLKLERQVGHNPLFDVIFVLQNMEQQELTADGLTFAPYRFEQKQLPLDLSIEAHDQTTRMEFNLQYSTRLYRVETIRRMIRHFEQLVRQVLRAPEVQLKEIDLLLTDEKRWLLEEWNQTAVEFSLELTVQRMVEDQVQQTPEATALLWNGQQMGYREWNRRANMLARVLRKKGIQREEIVGISCDHSFDLAIAILAVLKSGAAYLPIDPAYPTTRKKYLLADSRVRVVLTDSQSCSELEFTEDWLDLTEPTLWQANDEDLESFTEPTDPAYVIYTSGSTGKPKGVLIEHQSVSNLLQWRRKEYRFTEQDICLQLVSSAFDGFVVTFFTPLISGARVVLLPTEEMKNPQRIGQVLFTEQITHFMCVPFLYSAILDYLINRKPDCLRSVGLAGDQITEHLRQKSKRILPQIELFSEYGLTECTVVSTWERNLQLAEKVTIGRPIANTQVYILDRNNRLSPVGVPGELCIGGVGLAREYLRQPELMREKFAINPLNSEERLYHSGDRGRWTVEGKIEFLGRLDYQVKIRGLRIEIGEIEESLLAIPEITAAVVLSYLTGEDGQLLCGFVAADREMNFDQLRVSLAESLPNYMIPAKFIQIEELPVSVNGKVDRQALRKLVESAEIEGEYIPPSTELERLLTQIYREVLQVERIGITDHFFELGGHSLKAVTLITKLNQACQVQLTVGDIFKAPRIRELAAKIQSTTRQDYEQIKRLPEQSHYPLSPAQKRLFILDQLMGETTSFNMPAVLEIQRELKVERLITVFQALIQRHESLRTSFRYLEGQPVQFIQWDGNFQLQRFVAVTQVEIDQIIADFIQPFDLEKGPLLRVGLIEGVERNLLLIDLHHIIADGVSMMILIQEFVQLYSGQLLSELTIQYRDYAYWQSQRQLSVELKKQEEYWVEAFSGELPVLNLPTDYPRPSVKGYAGEVYSFVLDQDLTARLKRLALETTTTLFMILLAAYTIFLAKYSDLEDVIVGTSTAGRFHNELEGVIGIFLNTLALRNYPIEEKRFDHYLSEVKVNTLRAFEHQDYQFESLVERLGLLPDLSRNPIFDVMFVFENMDSKLEELEKLGFIPYPIDREAVKYDLTLYGKEAAGQLELEFAYRKDLFTRDTIVNLAAQLVQIIQKAVDDPEIKISEIQGSSTEKKQALLAGLLDDLEDE